MKDEERDALNRLTAVQGETPHIVGEVAVRRVSLESLCVLELVGCSLASRFASALNGQRQNETEAPSSLVDLALFLWAHVAHEDEVLRVALGCSPSHRMPAVAAALEFSRQAGGLQDVPALVEAITQDVLALVAANFGARSPFEGSTKKKA